MISWGASGTEMGSQASGFRNSYVCMWSFSQCPGSIGVVIVIPGKGTQGPVPEVCTLQDRYMEYRRWKCKYCFLGKGPNGMGRWYSGCYLQTFLWIPDIPQATWVIWSKSFNHSDLVFISVKWVLHWKSHTHTHTRVCIHIITCLRQSLANGNRRVSIFFSAWGHCGWQV